MKSSATFKGTMAKPKVIDTVSKGPCVFLLCSTAGALCAQWWVLPYESLISMAGESAELCDHNPTHTLAYCGR